MICFPNVYIIIIIINIIYIIGKSLEKKNPSGCTSHF